jgi:hypothetical protein
LKSSSTGIHRPIRALRPADGICDRDTLLREASGFCSRSTAIAALTEMIRRTMMNQSTAAR